MILNSQLHVDAITVALVMGRVMTSSLRKDTQHRAKLGEKDQKKA